MIKAIYWIFRTFAFILAYSLKYGLPLLAIIFGWNVLTSGNCMIMLLGWFVGIPTIFIVGGFLSRVILVSFEVLLRYMNKSFQLGDPVFMDEDYYDYPVEGFSETEQGDVSQSSVVVHQDILESGGEERRTGRRNFIFERRVIPISEIHFLPELTPPYDKYFAYLLEEACAGRVPVYFAAIPLDMVHPFDPDFNVEGHPIGKKSVDAIFQAWEEGELFKVWVYPKGDYFISSDDYPVLASGKRGKPDFLPCLVLGDPRLPGVKDIQGPIIVDDVRHLLGLK